MRCRAERLEVSRRGESCALGVIVSVYAVSRGLILRGWNDRLDTEEMSFGALPAHLFDGLLVPLLDYQTQWREGGSVLMAPVVGAVMAVLGDSVLAVKAGGLVWYGLALLAWYLAARLAFGPLVAIILGALLAVAPPFLTAMQFTMLAGHGEAQLLSGLALACAVAAMRRAHTPLLLFGTGLLAVLGGVFAYSAAPLGACLLAWLAVRGPGTPRARLSLLAAGGLVGLMPWIAFFVVKVAPNLPEGDESIGLLTFVLGGSNFLGDQGAFALLRGLISETLFTMWGWPDAVGHYRGRMNYVFGTVIFGLLSAAALDAAFGSRSEAAGWARDPISREVIITLQGFVGLYVVLALASAAKLSPDVFDGYRYLLPLQYVALLLAAAGLGTIASVRQGLPVAVATFALLLAVTGGPMLRAATAEPERSPLWGLRGYTLQPVREELAVAPHLLIEALAERPETRTELSVLYGFVSFSREENGQLPPRPEGGIRPLVIEGAGRAMMWALLGKEPWVGEADALRWLAAAPAPVRDDMLRGVGRGVRLDHRVRPALARADAVLLRGLGPRELELVAEGIGLQDVLGNNFHFARSGVPRAAPLAYARGTGRALARLVLDPAEPPVLDRLPAQLITLLDDTERDALRAGYRAELARLSRARTRNRGDHTSPPSPTK